MIPASDEYMRGCAADELLEITSALALGPSHIGEMVVTASILTKEASLQFDQAIEIVGTGGLDDDHGVDRRPQPRRTNNLLIRVAS